MELHGISCNIMSCMGYNGIACNHMESHGISWNNAGMFWTGLDLDWGPKVPEQAILCGDGVSFLHRPCLRMFNDSCAYKLNIMEHHGISSNAIEYMMEYHGTCMKHVYGIQ